MLSLFTTRAFSAAVLITNPGFESNILANPGAGQNDNFITAVGQGVSVTSVPGWTFSTTQTSSFSSYAGVSDLAVGNHVPEGALDNNVAWFFIQEGKQTATLSANQTLGEALQNNTRYTLTARVAQSAHAEGNPAFKNPIFPTLGNGVDTGDVFARLWVNNSSTPMPGHIVAASSVSAPGDNLWVNWTLVWETGASEPLVGGTLGIELFSRANTVGYLNPVEVFFDDIALNTAAAPEPSRAVLMLAGIALICARRSRKS